MIHIGSKLRRLRLNKNMTQMQLATKLGLTKSVISAYETGIRLPSYESLITISQTFDVSTDFLLGIEQKNQLDFSGLSEDQVNALKYLVNTIKNETAS